jgi:hypothetical protein
MLPQQNRFSLDYIDDQPWTPNPNASIRNLLRSLSVQIESDFDPAWLNQIKDDVAPRVSNTISYFELLNNDDRRAAEIVDLLQQQGFRPAGLKTTLEVFVTTAWLCSGREFIALNNPLNTSRAQEFPIISHNQHDGFCLSSVEDDPQFGLREHCMLFAYKI